MGFGTSGLLEGWALKLCGFDTFEDLGTKDLLDSCIPGGNRKNKLCDSLYLWVIFMEIYSKNRFNSCFCFELYLKMF